MKRKHSVRFLEIAEKWLESKRNKVEETSIAKYSALIFGSLKAAFGQKKINEISPEILRQYIRSRKDHIASLRHEIESNPCDLVSVPRKIRKGIAVLRDEDIVRL